VTPSSFQLGITGGIGSGKSTVAALLTQWGAAHIDADACARAATAPGGAAIPAIRSTFGDAAVNRQGALNRDYMRALVFADAVAKQRLEAIVHPLVGQAITQAVRVAQHSGHRLMVLDIPLLSESAHWTRQLDAVLVVDCCEATQIARVTTRSGLAEDAVRAIMSQQNDRATRRAAADMVLYNEGLTLEELRCQVQAIATLLLGKYDALLFSQPL